MVRATNIDLYFTEVPWGLSTILRWSKITLNIDSDRSQRERVPEMTCSILMVRVRSWGGLNTLGYSLNERIKEIAKINK